jgi:hypothetical protein
MVVALDARTGRVAWQDQNRASERDRYTGRRTGAQTVYQPAGLFTARSSVDGTPVLISAGADEVRAYNPWNGERKWEHTFTENPGCHDVDWTGETTYVAKDSCAAPAVLEIFDAATGKPRGLWRAPGVSAAPAEDANWYAEPVSCVRGRSGCGLIRAAALPVVESEGGISRGVQGVPGLLWRLNHDGSVVEEKHATSERTFLLGETLVQQEVPDSGHIKTIMRSTGTEVRRSLEPLQLLAVNHDGIYAMTNDFQMVLLHPTTLIEVSRVDLRRRANENWQVGFVDVVGHMVIIERTTGGSPNETDDRYYFGPSPVVIASV